MSLHILIGHEKPGQRGTAEALYVGDSGQALQLAKARTTCGSFTILNNPTGLRKSNPGYIPTVKAEAAPETAPAAETEPAPKAKARK
jgi:hypothetical protein